MIALLRIHGTLAAIAANSPHARAFRNGGRNFHNFGTRALKQPIIAIKLHGRMGWSG
jgi:hypothetical protein